MTKSTMTMLPAGAMQTFTTVDSPAPKNRTMPNRGYGPGFRMVTDGNTSHQELDKVWPRTRGNADTGVGKTKG